MSEEFTRNNVILIESDLACLKKTGSEDHARVLSWVQLGSKFIAGEDFMRLRRQANDSETCCKISVIDQMLEKFPPIEVRHILKMAYQSETLEGYCIEYERHLAKLMEYVTGCCFDHKHHLVKQQIEGLEELHVSICLNKPIFDLLVKNARCLSGVLDSSKECLAKETTRADPNSKDNLCPRLRSFIDCYTEQASNECSLESASLLNKLFKRVVKATIRVDCGVCFHVRSDAQTTSYIDRGRLTATIIVLCMIIFSLLILKWGYSVKTCV